MNVATLEDDTDRPIQKELRICNRIAKPRLNAAEIFPIVCEFTIYEERRSITIRDQPAISEMQRLAAQVVVSETRPVVGPAICWTHECSELFAAGVAAVGGNMLSGSGWEYGGNVPLVGMSTCPGRVEAV
jgi:hypothetical protein